LAREVLTLLGDADQRAAMKQSLAAWHSPEAAAEMAERMLHWTENERTGPASVARLAGPPAAQPSKTELGVLNV
jgi:hypothetical protein